ncbi:MAG: zinc-binding alcohol dehydrogenase [Candidatus Brocadiaceae bacterium]|jgi:threonine dehydrogenase-like Zn-dependent dehydrogenase
MPTELRAVEPGKVEFSDYELPELGADEVRVETEFAAAKHGTEMAMLKGYAAARGPWNRKLALHEKAEASESGWWSFAVGNMFVGRVTEVGSGVSDPAVGERVLAYGPFREMQTVAASACRVMPEGLSWKAAVCLDPADFAMAALRDGNVRVGDAVAVFGMGAIGLMVVQMARTCGAHPVIAVEPLENRRQAAEACGAHLALDPAACDAGKEIKLATEKRGADVVIEYSGNVQALQDALRAVAFGGNVVAGAFPSPYPAGLDLGAEAHLNIPNVIFSRACSEPNRDHPRWDEGRIYATCWRMICAGELRGEHIITPVVPFRESADAYGQIAESPGTNIKLGVEFAS